MSHSILVANRGECAMRVMRTCQRMGIDTIAVYEAGDRMHVGMATRAVQIPSYTDMQSVVDVAKKMGASAIHPGYGFLSESPEFVTCCQEAGILFIGPSAESMQRIGNKAAAKVLLETYAPNVPLVPGYHGDAQDMDTLVKAAEQIGFPLMIKSASGGGGKGMRIVRDISTLQEEIKVAKSESARYFGSEKLILELYIPHGRHIEIQIIGDGKGNVDHLMERECSIQRRHQKIIEECPSPFVNEELRCRMTASAMNIARLLNYSGVGTVEFIANPATRDYYFLEVNTRLQVEHPITELVFGIDLVEMQIRIAFGARLHELPLASLVPQGHAIECRLYAENPYQNFAPCPGKVLAWQQIVDDGVRYDAGIKSGEEVTVRYDPMIAKISVHAPTRSQAIAKMRHVLRRTICLGIWTNQVLLGRVMNHPNFVFGDYDTRFIESFFSELLPMDIEADSNRMYQRLIASTFVVQRLESKKSERHTLWPSVSLRYRNVRHSPRMKHCCRISNGTEKIATLNIDFNVNSNNVDVDLSTTDEMASVERFCTYTRSCKHVGDMSVFDIEIAGVFEQVVVVAQSTDDIWLQNNRGDIVHIERVNPLNVLRHKQERQDDDYVAPMPCRILAVCVQNGMNVHKGDVILSVESMKMETRVLAWRSGRVELHVKVGDVVAARYPLCSIADASTSYE